MKNSLKNILYVAYTFPPLAYAGTFRTYRFCRMLPSKGYDITVLTIKERKEAHNDYTLLKEIKNKVEIVRTTTWDPWLSYQTMKPKILKNPVGKIINKFMSLLFNLINQPDHMIFWVPFAVINGIRTIKRKNIQIIITTSPPFSTLITGYLLKRIMKKRWVVDLRDPLQDNMAIPYWNFFTKKINFLLEKIVVKHADNIITTTQTAARKLNQRYQLNKAVPIYNSYDENDFIGIEKEKNEHKFTIVHVGTMYWFRRSDILFEVIEKLKNEGTLNPDNFELLFIGINDQSLTEIINKRGLKALIRLVPMVSHNEAIRYMQNADMLLIIKGTGKNSDTQIPSKLFEYIGTGNPILFIGPLESEAAEIVKSLENGFVVENDEEYLSKVLRNAIEKKFNEKNFMVADRGGNQNIKKFSSKYMANKLVEVLENKNNNGKL